MSTAQSAARATSPVASIKRGASIKQDRPQLSRAALQLLWVTGCFLLAVLPHLSSVRWWIGLLAACAAAWRLVVEIKQRPLPHRLLCSAIALIAVVATLTAYRTLNGLEAGTAFLVLMGGMKLLESRTARDLTVVLFVSYFLLFAGFLYNLGLLSLPYMLVAAWLLTGTLMLIHQASPMSIAEALRKTGKMLLQALPIAVLMFLFFPRLPGQFWALPAQEKAMTGLSDTMSPGDVSELSVSGKLAFRVKFDDNVLPPPRERYWRGPVLHDFDGRTWRRTRYGFVERPLVATGPTYRYRVVIEPHNRNWVFSLDAVTGWPKDARRTSDYQLVTWNRAISRLSSFTLESSTSFRTEGPLPTVMEKADLRLPEGRNPKSVELAKSLRANVGSNAEFVQAVLSRFRNEKFYYTLEPPRLEADSVDDFLFNTRRGFCEHYASAFVVLARAAGIPARIVTGYQGGEYNPLNDYLIVSQSDAHAWAEVWLDEQGWVRVDPTAAIAPDRIEQGRAAALSEGAFGASEFLAGNAAWLKVRQGWDAINTFWNDNVVDFGQSQQRSLLERLGLDNPGLTELGTALLLSFIAFFAAISAWLAWQFRPRARDPIVRVYDALCRQLGKAGIVRQPHEGPNDYLSRVVVQRPELTAQITEIRALYVGLRYGPALLGSQLSTQLSRFKFLVNQLRT
jgi:transglutaminase-like putative cysteine protease